MSKNADLKFAWKEAAKIWAEANDAFAGRSAKILSSYNGQPYGRSSGSLTGRVLKIVGVHFDMNNGVSLHLEGQRLYISLDEVEIL